MAATARQTAKSLRDWRTSMPTTVGGRVSVGLLPGEDLTIHAFGGAGFAALVFLPLLLIASVIFAAPLAVPAAIGLGYLATSRALATRYRRFAALMNISVLLALVGWLLLYLALAD